MPSISPIKEERKTDEVKTSDRETTPPKDTRKDEKTRELETGEVEQETKSTTSSRNNGSDENHIEAKNKDAPPSPLVTPSVSGADGAHPVIIPRPMLLRRSSIPTEKKEEEKQQEEEKKEANVPALVADSEIEIDKADGMLLSSDDVVRTWSPATPESAPLHLSSKVSPLPAMRLSGGSGDDNDEAEDKNGEGEGAAPPNVEKTPSYHEKDRAKNGKKGSTSHGDGHARHVDPTPVVPPRLLLWDLPATFSHMIAYCNFKTICQLLRVNHRFYTLATDEAVWRRLLEYMNLQPLLTAFNVKSNYYRFFLEEVITTRALHGHYTFAAAPPAPDKHKNNSGHGFNGIVRTLSPCSSDDLGDAFLVEAVTLLVSSAELGQMNHPIGRVQLLTKYKNDTMEVLQGSCRFSVYRRCYSLCCNVFANAARGPVFTVAIATATKPWANQSQDHFQSHKGGLRLVMTPALWEGQCLGSQISETDVIAVSKPPTPIQPPFA